ncbi:hypothetical protein ACIQWN_37930 [Streptomyces vinaceus]|uniref:hypothetical protein n=1 Tax=Streptomyces vinaceus TaxID=1960 RepID=UPI0038268DA0
MYVMKQLAPGDVPALNGLLGQRMSWLAQKGLPLSGESCSLMEPARLSEPEPGMYPIGMWDGDQLVAALAVQIAVPVFGWTLEERLEQSLVLSLAHTLPERTGLLGILVAGLCDYAARLPCPLDWIRCTVRPYALADYLARSSGWTKVREVGSPFGNSHHLFQRLAVRAEPMTLPVRTEGELV